MFGQLILVSDKSWAFCEYELKLYDDARAVYGRDDVFGIVAKKYNDYYKCLAAKTKQQTVTPQQQINELEKQIAQALGRGDVSAAASLVQQLRSLNAQLASNYQSQLDTLQKNSTNQSNNNNPNNNNPNNNNPNNNNPNNNNPNNQSTQSCTYAGQTYANCSDAWAQYNKDKAEYDKKITAKKCYTAPNEVALNYKYTAEGISVQVEVSKDGEATDRIYFKKSFFNSSSKSWETGDWTAHDSPTITQSIKTDPKYSHVTFFAHAQNACGNSRVMGLDRKGDVIVSVGGYGIELVNLTKNEFGLMPNLDLRVITNSESNPTNKFETWISTKAGTTENLKMLTTTPTVCSSQYRSSGSGFFLTVEGLNNGKCIVELVSPEFRQYTSDTITMKISFEKVILCRKKDVEKEVAGKKPACPKGYKKVKDGQYSS